MKNIELVLVALGLAMDAFAVAICKGLAMQKLQIKKAILIGLWFGFFQGLMPIIGYFLGNVFEEWMDSIEHLIAFGLLAFIGYHMVKDTYEKKENSFDETIGIKVMLILAIATSIDALTIGITFAFFEVNILLAAFIISSITFMLSIIGVIIGSQFGDKYGKQAQIVGGILLIGLGVKNLLEHFDVL